MGATAISHPRRRRPRRQHLGQPRGAGSGNDFFLECQIPQGCCFSFPFCSESHHFVWVVATWNHSQKKSRSSSRSMLKANLCCWKSTAIFWTPCELLLTSPFFNSILGNPCCKAKSSEAVKGKGRITKPKKSGLIWWSHPLTINMPYEAHKNEDIQTRIQYQSTGSWSGCPSMNSSWTGGTYWLSL